MTNIHTCIQCGKSVSNPSHDFCSDDCEKEQHRWLEYVGPSPAATVFWYQFRLLQREFLRVLNLVAKPHKRFMTIMIQAIWMKASYMQTW